MKSYLRNYAGERAFKSTIQHWSLHWWQIEEPIMPPLISRRTPPSLFKWYGLPPLSNTTPPRAWSPPWKAPYSVAIRRPRVPIRWYWSWPSNKINLRSVWEGCCCCCCHYSPPPPPPTRWKGPSILDWLGTSSSDCGGQNMCIMDWYSTRGVQSHTHTHTQRYGGLGHIPTCTCPTAKISLQRWCQASY